MREKAGILTICVLFSLMVAVAAQQRKDVPVEAECGLGQGTVADQAEWQQIRMIEQEAREHIASMEDRMASQDRRHEPELMREAERIKMDETARILDARLERIRQDGVEVEELQKAREQLQRPSERGPVLSEEERVDGRIR